MECHSEQSQILSKRRNFAQEAEIMILLIDNYDSFSYNLSSLLRRLIPDIKVIRNDEMTVEEKRTCTLTALFSPVRQTEDGHDSPLDAVKNIQGIPITLVFVPRSSRQYVRHLVQPLLTRKERMHGKTIGRKFDISLVRCFGAGRLKRLPRSHGIILLRQMPTQFPEYLKSQLLLRMEKSWQFSAKEYPIYGVQFHRRSIMTPDRMETDCLENFIKEI